MAAGLGRGGAGGAVLAYNPLLQDDAYWRLPRPTLMLVPGALEVTLRPLAPQAERGRLQLDLLDLFHLLVLLP